MCHFLDLLSFLVVIALLGILTFLGIPALIGHFSMKKIILLNLWIKHIYALQPTKPRRLELTVFKTIQNYLLGKLKISPF
jgi:hypothetical protein